MFEFTLCFQDAFFLFFFLFMFAGFLAVGVCRIVFGNIVRTELGSHAEKLRAFREEYERLVRENPKEAEALRLLYEAMRRKLIEENL